MSYQKRLDQLQEIGRMRSFSAYNRCGGAAIEKNGKTYINLSSNDYLGLAGDVEIQKKFYQKMDQLEGGDFLDSFGLGAASSRLLSGDYSNSHALEQVLATAYGAEAALLFNSGYHANIGILPALAGKGDLVLSDKLNHASIHDGLQLCLATHKRFNHRDYVQLRRMLERHRDDYKRVFIVSESVFSMDGDVADIRELVALKGEFDCLLYLDEAHAVGLYGIQGLGKVEEYGLLAEVDIVVGTFGKAYASVGAYCICSMEIQRYLINHSRSLIFTTALPAVTQAWNLFVFQHAMGMVAERKYLAELSNQLRESIRDLGLVSAGSTNIVPVIIGGDRETVSLAKILQENGFYLLPVRPPTVPKGTSRFRISLGAHIQWHDVQNLGPCIAEHI